MLDAIIIAEDGINSFSGSNPMRLTLAGRPGSIQTVHHYVANNGDISSSLEGIDAPSWASAPKLNGIALLSHLGRHGFSARLVNSFIDEADFAEALEDKPRAIIISTSFIISKSDLTRLVAKIRNLAPGIPLIAGGPFVQTSWLIRSRVGQPHYDAKTLQKDYLFWGVEEPDLDLLVVSPRGESVLRQALQRIKEGLPLAGIANTAWRQGEDWHIEPRVEETIDPFEPIAWDLLPDEIFSNQVISMQASLGCPYSCSYCNFVKDPSTMCVKPLDDIIAELLAVQERGVRYVWFVDDIFRLGKRDLNDVARAMIAAGVQVNWMCFIRADTVSSTDFDLLKQAGCLELQFGLESADPTVLAAMNKQAVPEIYWQVLRQALAAGINCSAYFIAGHPGETEESIERTIQFVEDVQEGDLPGVLNWSIYPFYLIPLSPLYDVDHRRQHNLQGYGLQWSHQTMDSSSAMAAVKKFFVRMKLAGLIYRDDNLDLLGALSPEARKQFHTGRHRLAKAAVANRLTDKMILETMGFLNSSEAN